MWRLQSPGSGLQRQLSGRRTVLQLHACQAAESNPPGLTKHFRAFIIYLLTTKPM
jgi:hypothetical protein